MRFFSNDSRQTSDDEARNDDRLEDDHPEKVKSDPVTVPQQRPPSPWAASPGTPSSRPTDDVTDTRHATADAPVAATVTDHRPGGSVDDRRHRDRSRDSDPTDDDLADDELAARETTDGTTESRSDDDIRPYGEGQPYAGERPPFHEPAPVPTAFGATTVGGAVAASALANPTTQANPDAHDTDRRSDGTAGAADNRLAGPAHAADLDRTDLDRTDLDRTDLDRTDHDRAGLDPAGLDPAGLDPAGLDRTDDDRAGLGGRSDDVTDEALRDDGTFDAPDVAESTTPAGISEDSTTSRMGATTAATRPDDRAAAVPSMVEEQLPGTVAAPELGPLFGDRDAHTFRDRWRDVQLRFVDDPKGAADEAATLVDEAVDALATSIRAQKEQLNSGATNESPGDTEQLRVRLRSYRDFLDRLLDL